MKNEMELLKTDTSAWFKHWFNSSFYHQLYAHRDEKEAVDFIDQLLIYLQPRHNACIMDLGCGAGRHAKYLASKGFMVTGTDLAFNSIKSAKKFETAALQFYKHDMRLPFGDHHFDYVFNFFTSFGYFKNEVENYQVIANISNALKPGGIVMMDYINVAYSEDRMVPEEEKEIDGVAYYLTRWSDKRYFYKRIVIDDVLAEGSFEYVEQVAKFNLTDFENMFSSNGLRLQKVFGDYRLNDYANKTSPRLILLAKR